MIEDSLEEELLDEFKGGTLSINAENKQISDKQSAAVIRASTEADGEASSGDKSARNNNYWGSNFITPLTSIQSKLSATIWSAKTQPAAAANEQQKSKGSSNSIQQSICLTENPTNFFTFRESVLAKALAECKEQFLDEETDGPLIEAYLLTQISHWNSDKERLLLLTPQYLVIAKYDFIALKRLGYKKLPLDMIDELIIGELVYPSGSLIPQMNGFVDGLSNVLETCLFAKWSKGENKHLNFYEPRNRNMKGVRLMWKKDQPTNLTKEWNPFNEDLPFCTFTYHPLYFHKDCVEEKLKNLYSLDSFIEKLSLILAELPRNLQDNLPACTIQEKNIILQSYVNIASIIHNRNSLGFFKVRGKFSF